MPRAAPFNLRRVSGGMRAQYLVRRARLLVLGLTPLLLDLGAALRGGCRCTRRVRVVIPVVIPVTRVSMHLDARSFRSGCGRIPHGALCLLRARSTLSWLCRGVRHRCPLLCENGARMTDALVDCCSTRPLPAEERERAPAVVPHNAAFLAAAVLRGAPVFRTRTLRGALNQ